MNRCSRVYVALPIMSTMRAQRRHLAALIAIIALFGLSAGASASKTTPIRMTQVDLRDYPTVHLTVVTPVVGGLPPALAENGAPAAGVAAENLGSRAAIVLAIDRSQSMHGQTLTHALSASRAFLASKPTGYQVSVVTFASQALLLSPFSSSNSDADAALRSVAIDPRIGTTLYDSVVIAAHDLQSQGSAGRVIILITDGQETTSRATLDQAIAAARRSTNKPAQMEPKSSPRKTAAARPAM